MDKTKTYWILREGNPWSVLNVSTGAKVAEVPAFNHDEKLMEAICFAENDEKVREILRGSNNAH